MLKVGINGLGRIGRAIFRNNLEQKSFKIVAINDINPDIGNIAYTLNYDTLYDRLAESFKVDYEKSYIYNSTHNVKVFHQRYIDEVNWKSQEVDIVIDATGVAENVRRAKSALEKHSLKKVLITHSPNTGIDFTMVLGANENQLDCENHMVIASSICDATAIAPVFKIIQTHFGIQNGYVTTLHPWLNYQNLMDGPASSWSVPGEIYHHYALGRSAIGNIIPKPTSAIQATCKVLEDVTEQMIGSFSYRTPTAIVGSADITLVTKKTLTKQDLIRAFELYENEQKWNIIHNNFEPLVSLDFKKSPFSAIVDHRWSDVIGGNLVKLVLWYDNEWGYSARVCDQVKLVTELIKSIHL